MGSGVVGVEQWRKALNLQPHPEGGFFCETFRDESVELRTDQLPSRFKVNRPVSTSIYFLMPSGSVSHLHRIPAAEVWHFYEGEPLTVVELEENGNVKHTILGRDVAAGQVFQYNLPPNIWFGAYPTNDFKVNSESGTFEKLEAKDPEYHYSLVGCTVAPAFQFADFELGKREELTAMFPQSKDLVTHLTWDE